MRKAFIAGNWKMYTDVDEAVALVSSLNQKMGGITKVDVLVCPPAVNLDGVNKVLAGSQIKLGAQNMHFEMSGAYTGEISGSMLRAVGCRYVIVGHSERRAYFEETDEMVNKKIKAAFEQGLIPIMCVGETLEQREAGKTFDVIEKQVVNGLVDTIEYIVNNNKEIVLAYEPIWAIGTGKVATPEQAQEVHKFIRNKLKEIFNEKVAQDIRIQYGGSVKPENIKDLIVKEDIDGALVGGASLKVDSFCSIIDKVIG
jgi:triosephosphate isomerase (TIM)